MLTRIFRAFNANANGYDATETRGRRRAIQAKRLSEDAILPDHKRAVLSGNAHDLARNFVIAAWAIRKHLDYTTAFSFQAQTGDEVFDRELEAFVNLLSTPRRFDYAARHGRERAVRIAEACKLKDGDLLLYRRRGPQSRKRGTIQAVESDLIRLPRAAQLPKSIDPEEFVNGVRIDRATGESRGYAVCSRARRMQPAQLKAILPARDCMLHAAYDRFDQVRGVSPIAAGLNWFRDAYEGFEYGLAKLKINQLFGLVTTRDADLDPWGQGAATPTADADDDGIPDAKYEVDPGAGPFYLDLQPGDKMDFIEAKTPSTETVKFLQYMVLVAIQSLDIPYSFLDPAHSNFYSSRGGLIQYLKSSRNKVNELAALQDAWLRWRLGLAVLDGEFQLPSGQDFNFLRWSFVNEGTPWWDRNKETKGASNAVAAAFTSPQRICRETGTHFETVVDEIAAAKAYAEARGVRLSYGDNSADPPDFTLAESDTEA